MNRFYAFTLAIIAAISMGIQPTINAALGKYIPPEISAFHSLLTSTLLMLIIILFKGNMNQYKNIINVNPIYWLGGVFGLLIVLLGLKAIPVLGTTISFSIFVSVQLIVAAIINHFGWLEVPISPITPTKIIGMILMLIGVKLIL